MSNRLAEKWRISNDIFVFFINSYLWQQCKFHTRKDKIHQTMMEMLLLRLSQYVFSLTKNVSRKSLKTWGFIRQDNHE